MKFTRETLPKNAKTVARRVVDLVDDLGRRRSGVEEVAATPDGRQCYIWAGWYHQTAAGPRRIVRRCKKIRHCDATAIADAMDHETP